jgi:hypothetical protein
VDGYPSKQANLTVCIGVREGPETSFRDAIAHDQDIRNMPDLSVDPLREVRPFRSIFRADFDRYESAGIPYDSVL